MKQGFFRLSNTVADKFIYYIFPKNSEQQMSLTQTLNIKIFCLCDPDNKILISCIGKESNTLTFYGINGIEVIEITNLEKCNIVEDDENKDDSTVYTENTVDENFENSLIASQSFHDTRVSLYILYLN